MGNWAYHWLYLDFWVPVWPNLAASAVLGPMVWFKLQAIHKLHQEHFNWHKERDHHA